MNMPLLSATRRSDLSFTNSCINTKPSSSPIKQASKLCAALCAAYLALAPTIGFSLVASWHDEQRVVQLMVLLACALFAVVVAARRSVARGGASLLLSIALGLAAISAVHSENVTAGLAEVGLWVSLLLLASTIAIYVSADRAQSVKLVPRVALLITIAHIVGILARYMGAMHLRQPPDALVVLLGYANPRFPSALYALLIPFLVELTASASERRVMRWTSALALMLLWCFNVALETRAIAFSYLVGLITIVCMLGWQPIRRFVGVLVVSAVAGVALYLLLFQLLPVLWVGEAATLVRTDPILSPNGRQFLLASSWDAMRSAPFLGIGPMGFAAIPHVWAAHPHNWILQAASEWGIPATLFLVLAVGLFLVRQTREVRSQLLVSPSFRSLALPAYVSVVIGLIYGLVDGNLIMPVSQTAFFVVLGALIGATSLSRVLQAEPDSISSLSRLLVPVVGLGAILALAHFAVATYPQREKERREYHLTYAPDRFFVPRFWEQGLLLNTPSLTKLR
jgi:O-antigen ligase